ncbi:MAG: GWxTD domain-containing protein [Gemmatimonadota bacterium]
MGTGALGRGLRRGPRWWVIGVALATLPGAGSRPAKAQTMPGPVYHELLASGHQKLAERIAKKLDHRAHPDGDDVRELLDRWVEEEGGPDSGYDWLAVTRLWLRAGRAAEAEMALHRAEGGVAPGQLLLDQARVAFLAKHPALGEEAYWKGCEVADDAGSLEYWLDIGPLATPDEADEWDRFRTLPSNQRDLCAFLRVFWSERALASTVTVGQRISQHYERLRYALDNYTRRSGKKGPTFSTEMGRPRNATFDDRGLIYLRMGEPDRKTGFAGGGSGPSAVAGPECFEPNESWAYDYPDGTRVYHFTTGNGLDDWWLVDNLAEVYRCGTPNGTLVLSPLGEGRLAPIALSAPVVLGDLYASRGGLDTRYYQMGFRSRQSSFLALQLLQEERHWTHADAEFAIRDVPERPAVDMEPRLLFEALQYRATSPTSTRVWLNGVIEAEKLLADPLEDGRFRYRVDAVWAVLDEDAEFRRLRSEFETITDHRLDRDESIPVRMVTALRPGRYRYTVAVRDAQDRTRAGVHAGNYLRDALIVRDFAGDRPLLSDIAVAADSGGTWSPGGGIFLRLTPAHATGPDGIAYVYYEAYNLTPGGDYVTRVRLEPKRDGAPFELTFPGEAQFGGAATRRYLRLDLRGTEPGAYRMSVTVEDRDSGLSTLPYTTDLVVEASEQKG